MADELHERDLRAVWKARVVQLEKADLVSVADRDQVLWFTFCWLHNVYATGVLSVR